MSRGSLCLDRIEGEIDRVEGKRVGGKRVGGRRKKNNKIK